MTAVLLGIDRLMAKDFEPLRRRRVGLLTNPSGVDSKLCPTTDLLAQADAVNLVALFAPEHGFTATVADGEKFDDTTDPRTGVPVFSLYGDSMRPTAEMLNAVDVIVVDIQDVGARFYTYVWTLSHLLEAAGEHDTEVLVLDRPNPLGGSAVRGAVLDEQFDTLVGRYPIPIQHGMTIGELAQMFNAVWNPTPAPLTVIPYAGWDREMRWHQTGLTWVPPSPAMPHLHTVQNYPGACLVEGTTLSEGRGTALPFQVVGAPFIDGPALADALNGLDLPTVTFRPHTFTPSTSKYAGEVCGGVQVHLLTAAADAVEIWVRVLTVIWEQYGAQVAWRDAHFDRLSAIRRPAMPLKPARTPSRRCLRAGASTAPRL